MNRTMISVKGGRVLLLSCLFTYILIFNGCCDNSITLGSLVEEMKDREALSYFPEDDQRHQQFSSYNRASVAPDREGWYANFDMSHFIRVETHQGRREFVLLDTDGPGAIVRWWMTFYRAQNGILRVYVDHDPDPVLEAAPRELLSGTLLAMPPLAVSVQEGAVLGEEGRDYDHNFYVPLPFSSHCKVTYENDSLVLQHDLEGTYIEEGYYWPDVFYNIGCRLYKAPVRVESVTREALVKARPRLDEAGRFLEAREVQSNLEEAFKQLLLPGDSVMITLQKERCAINFIGIELEAMDMPQALRSVVLKASFDGYQTIWAPVGDFFGTGYSLNPHQTWMNYRDRAGRMGSLWVMPFRDSCQLVFTNYCDNPVNLEGVVGLKKYRWNDRSMYFGTSWHQYHRIDSRDEHGAPFDLNFVNIVGKGRYVGDQLTLYNRTYHWWGEGDEKIFVDGEVFPSSFGTGSEDYFGYSFARPEPFSHPFVCQPEGTGNTGRGLTVNARHRSLDAIPFHSSISANIELWHWANVPVDVALTAYWYVRPPFETNIVPDPRDVRVPIPRVNKSKAE